MPVNARDVTLKTFQKVICVGEPGSGKTAQIATLNGKKFVYAFDPGTLPLLSTRKIDADVEEFLPDVATVDFSIKGFNRGSKSDAPSNKKSPEPTAYTAWEKHFNDWFDRGLFDAYDWIVFDSLTLFVKAIMNRLLFLNNRFGDIEELSDYRVVGNKLSTAFTAIASMKKNLYVTGHITTFQDETTKRITTQLGIPGASRDMLPKLFSNIWLLQASAEDKAGYTMLTRAEPRGFQAIRTMIPNLQPREDVTIDWSRPEECGIGAIVAGKRRPGARPVIPVRPTTTLPHNAVPLNQQPKATPGAVVPAADSQPSASAK